jgi:lysyl-tRNA synthetase class 2
MKRLLSAGYARIFQICKCFRHRERGRNHLSEFTMLEWYCAGIDYFDFMDQCEGLVRTVAHGLGTPDTLHYQNHTVDISAPWSRMSVADAFSRWAKLTPEAALAQDRFEEIMVNDIEPMLGFDKPTFLYDYPAACGSLARLDPLRSDVAQRFELYICGLELCNAFVELTDPVEQRVRFEDERSAMARAGKTCHALPEAFLSALGDMPEAAGNAMGIDRLVMIFADTRCIDDVVAFTPEES